MATLVTPQVLPLQMVTGTPPVPLPLGLVSPSTSSAPVIVWWLACNAKRISVHPDRNQLFAAALELHRHRRRIRSAQNKTADDAVTKTLKRQTETSESNDV